MWPSTLADQWLPNEGSNEWPAQSANGARVVGTDRLVGYDSKARKRRYSSKTVRGTKRDAERALAKFVTEVAEGGRVATGPISVERVLTQWLEAKKTQLSQSTADRYRVAMKLIPAEVQKMPVAKLRAHHIEDLYADLLASGQSGSSIRKVHWALRQSLAWAHERGYTGLIATDGVDLPPLGERKLTPPPSTDVRKLVEHMLADDPDWGTLVAVVAWTGCRRGEVCALRWEDVDLDGKSILIHRSVVAVPGRGRGEGNQDGRSTPARNRSPDGQAAQGAPEAVHSKGQGVRFHHQAFGVCLFPRPGRGPTVQSNHDHPDLRRCV